MIFENGKTSKTFLLRYKEKTLNFEDDKKKFVNDFRFLFLKFYY